MKKISLYILVIFCFLLWHYYKISKIEKQTALQILDILHKFERHIEPDTVDENTGIKYFSPLKYAKRTTVMDCEQLVYENYRLWE